MDQIGHSTQQYSDHTLLLEQATEANARQQNNTEKHERENADATHGSSMDLDETIFINTDVDDSKFDYAHYDDISNHRSTYLNSNKLIDSSFDMTYFNYLE
jgi:hypothetical protein